MLNYKNDTGIGLLGGAYEDLGCKLKKYERHHIPAKCLFKNSENQNRAHSIFAFYDKKGPSIAMTALDHSKTSSYRYNSASYKERNLRKIFPPDGSMIQNNGIEKKISLNGFKEVHNDDVDNIINNTAITPTNIPTYRIGIDQMRRYTNDFYNNHKTLFA